MVERPVTEPAARPSCRDGCQRMTAAGLCRWCAERLARELEELPNLVAEVEASTAAAGGNGERITGTRDAPVPVRVGAVSWIGSAPPGAVETDWPEDQTGPTPIAALLGSWARLVAEERHVNQPVGRVGALVEFLRRHHDWITAQMWADDYAGEVHAAWQVGRSLAGVRSDVFRLPVPCPTCSRTELVRQNGADRIECEGCGRIWRESEYRHLVLVLAAELREAG